MTAESALLGTPTLSCFPSKPTIIENYLVKKKLVYRTTDAEKAAKRITQILDNYENVRKVQQEKAKALMLKMEDPLDVIIKVVEQEFQ